MAAVRLHAADAADGNNADQPVRMSEVEIFTDKTSAITQSVTDSKLDAVQPMSFISAQTINNSIAPTADYATIANLAPSVANVETEGPGLSEAKQTQMRGFADGEYNVTYDGIPFGDVNGATHHTTSYFPAKVLGGIDVDRGPGTAATIGENTFGGTINLHSKDPRPDQAAVLTLSDGSWNSFLGNIEINSGVLPQANGASLVATYQYMSSDGYRTYSYLNRNTYYLKYVQPVGKDTTITVVGNYNNIRFNNPGTVTQAQMNQFGRNYGLSANPFDPNANYYGYNFQAKQADMEYIALDSKFADDFALDNKSYTYAYNNDSHEAPVVPVAGGTTGFPGKIYSGPTYANSSPITLPGTGQGTGLTQNDDPGGQAKINSYRVLGDAFAVSHGKDTSLAETFGVWGEYVRAVRYDYALDYSPQYDAANPQDLSTFGYIDPSTDVKSNSIKPGYQWFMHLYNKTFQPYLDLTWKPVPDLTIEAGVKDSNYTIDLEAPLNQKTEQPDFSNNTYTNVLPLISVNYLITPTWSAYGQAAEGVSYPIVTDEENVPSDAKDTAAGSAVYNPTNLKEQNTVNYQLGTVYKTDKFNADADVYLIDVSHIVSSVTDPNDKTNILFFQSKGAWVSGLEVEGTYYLGAGLSAVANGSLNRAVYKTVGGAPGFNVSALGSLSGGGYVPQSTGLVGLVYNHVGWFGSIFDKYVGPGVIYSSALVNPDLGLYGQTSSGNPGGTITPVRQEIMGGYALTDLAVGYAYKLPAGSWIHSIKVKLQLDNLFNRKVQVLSSAGSSAASDSFNVIPTSSYFVTVSTEF